jgi:hypothetical protein
MKGWQARLKPLEKLFGYSRAPESYSVPASFCLRERRFSVIAGACRRDSARSQSHLHRMGTDSPAAPVRRRAMSLRRAGLYLEFRRQCRGIRRVALHIFQP